MDFNQPAERVAEVAVHHHVCAFNRCDIAWNASPRRSIPDAHNGLESIGDCNRGRLRVRGHALFCIFIVQAITVYSLKRMQCMQCDCRMPTYGLWHSRILVTGRRRLEKEQVADHQIDLAACSCSWDSAEGKFRHILSRDACLCFITWR
jgi:hypothetical protein